MTNKQFSAVLKRKLQEFMRKTFTKEILANFSTKQRQIVMNLCKDCYFSGETHMYETLVEYNRKV